MNARRMKNKAVRLISWIERPCVIFVMCSMAICSISSFLEGSHNAGIYALIAMTYAFCHLKDLGYIRMLHKRMILLNMAAMRAIRINERILRELEKRDGEAGEGSKEREGDDR